MIIHVYSDKHRRRSHGAFAKLGKHDKYFLALKKISILARVQGDSVKCTERYNFLKQESLGD